jgi:hypothetical protein
LLPALLNTVPDLTGVGSRGFVESVKSILGGLARGRKVKKIGEGYQLREPSAPYGEHSGVKNEGYVASLELRKIYEGIPDERAAEHQMIRVVDESGEDYLDPSDFFIRLDLPKPVEQALALAM